VRFAFAVIGRDEAATLPGVLGMAFAAARRGDEVWFVDGASSDGSAALASSLGARVVAAPDGKGRAVAAALERCSADRLVLIDGDVQHAERNLALGLRSAAEADPDAAMVVGQAGTAGGKRSSISPCLYGPLVTALFPEVPEMAKPLSGFRVLDPARDHGALPAG
jgi:glycosyltransferase involved in cell wall biosynthesis